VARLAHGNRYASSRNVLLVATALGVLGFWLLPTRRRACSRAGSSTRWRSPAAPAGGGGGSAPRGMEGLSNQYAAMPSLHVGWAVWVALVVHRFSGTGASPPGRGRTRRSPRFVVVATANHYVVDALAGAAVVLVADVAVRYVGRQDGRPAR
jgi:hypothetical protein